MSRFIYTFKRYEKKYLLNEIQRRELMCRLRERLQPDEYGESLICNLYYDTPDYRLIRRSLDKPIYKEKLRVRCYNRPRSDSTAFIEIKKKFDGIVYKRRMDCTYQGAVDYLGGRGSAPPGQIKNELDWFLHSYPGLAPTVALFYTRTAWLDRENPDLRITFDSDILWRADDLDLTLGAYGTPMLRPEEGLMEIKIPAAMPVWLARALSETGCFPVSFSKYGTAFTQMNQKQPIFGGMSYA